MAEAFIFSTHISGGVRNRTGIATTRASAGLASLRPSTICPSFRAVNAFDFYNLSSNNFKIANQFSLVLK